MNIDIAKPCTHVQQMDRYYPSRSGNRKWFATDSTTSLPVYDDAPHGKDKPIIFDNYESAEDACDNLNNEEYEA